MTIRQTELGREVVVRFEEDLPLREAIELPGILNRRKAERIVLDFRRVRRVGTMAAAALIPALASVKAKAVWTLGLDRLDPELSRLGRTV